MAGRASLAGAVALLALATGAAAQPDAENVYRATLVLLPTHVTVATSDVVFLTGANASALRGCLDAPSGAGFVNCPGLGDGNGQVAPVEVDAYERWFMRRLNREEGGGGGSGPCEFSPGHTVRIDGRVRHPPCSNVVTAWELRGATGPVASTAAVTLDHDVVLYFSATALDAERHAVAYAKSPDERRDRSFNNRYEVWLVPGAGWRLDPDSVAPAWARERAGDGRLRFTEADPVEGHQATVRFNLTSGDARSGAPTGDGASGGEPTPRDTPGAAAAVGVAAFGTALAARRRRGARPVRRKPRAG